MRSAPTIAHGGVESRRPAKELDHIEVQKAENGGTVMKHVFTHYEHQPETHAFGKNETEKALAHISKHMGMAKGEADDETEEEELPAGKK